MITIRKDCWHYKFYSLFRTSPPSNLGAYVLTWSWFMVLFAALILGLEFGGSLLRFQSDKPSLLYNLAKGYPINLALVAVNLLISASFVSAVTATLMFLKTFLEDLGLMPESFFEYSFAAIFFSSFFIIISTLLGIFFQVLLLSSFNVEVNIVFDFIGINENFSTDKTWIFIVRSLITGVAVLFASLLFSAVVYTTIEWFRNKPLKIKIK